MRDYIRPLLILALAVALGCAAIAATAPCDCRDVSWQTIAIGGTYSLTPTDPASVLVDAPGVVLELPPAPADGFWYVVKAVYDVDVDGTGGWLDAPGVSLMTIGAGESVTFRWHTGLLTWFIIG